MKQSVVKEETPSVSNGQSDLAVHLHERSYLRERLQPQPGDYLYLHLSDLRLAVNSIATSERIRMLDYGCGGSPYRTLFPNAEYRRADFLQRENDALDYILSLDSAVPEEDKVFDFVLSTQVLEHVSSPAKYLQECHRLLRSGGRLYLSTHGAYEDHGCPYDYYRWTAEGLAKDVAAAGFRILRVEKQTAGPRAFFFGCDTQFRSLAAPKKTAFGMVLRASTFIYPKMRPWIHRMCDRHFSDYRVVIDRQESSSTYVVAACLAEKP